MPHDGHGRPVRKRNEQGGSPSCVCVPCPRASGWSLRAMAKTQESARPSAASVQRAGFEIRGPRRANPVGRGIGEACAEAVRGRTAWAAPSAWCGGTLSESVGLSNGSFAVCWTLEIGAWFCGSTASVCVILSRIGARGDPLPFGILRQVPRTGRRRHVYPRARGGAPACLLYDRFGGLAAICRFPEKRTGRSRGRCRVMGRERN
jgi:hypothetical protein